MPEVTIGSIIHDTLRPQDLVPAFLQALYDLDKAVAEVIIVAYDLEEYLVEPLDCAGTYSVIDEDAPFWSHPDIGYVISDLEDALENFAPTYCYFGAHPGDGAAFGFWIDNDAIEMAKADGDLTVVDDLADAPEGASEVLVVNDHGNMTYYERTGWEEKWSVV